MKSHKILKVIGLAAISAAVMVLLGFVASLRSTANCESLEVEYIGEPLGLIAEEVLRAQALVEGDVPVGMPLGEIDTRSIEQAVKALPHVREAFVYKTIDRKLIIEVEERLPVARLIDKHGRHALIDAEGHLIPLSAHKALRLPVISGHFAITPEAIQRRARVDEDEVDAMLYACYNYAMCLHNNPLWKAQLQHTEVTSEGEFVAHPQVGNHTITFGDGSRMDEKFQSLEIFYRQGMDASRWNKYSHINLKFKDQIVCTKK